MRFRPSKYTSFVPIRRFPLSAAAIHSSFWFIGERQLRNETMKTLLNTKPFAIKPPPVHHYNVPHLLFSTISSIISYPTWIEDIFVYFWKCKRKPLKQCVVNWFHSFTFAVVKLKNFPKDKAIANELSWWCHLLALPIVLSSVRRVHKI